MKRLALLLLAACGAGGDSPGPDTPDAPGGSDAPSTMCQVGLEHTPPNPVVVATDTPVFVQSFVTDAPGVLSYEWHLFRGAQELFDFELLDEGRVLSFAGDLAGEYVVSLDVTGAPSFCFQATRQIEIVPEGANQGQFRLHAVADGKAPLNTRVLVNGVAEDSLPALALGTVMAQGAIFDGAQLVPAYMKFIPQSAPDAFVEVFAMTGSYGAQLRAERHDVLIVPVSPALAPRRVTWQPGVTELVVDAGDAITGTVGGPGGPLDGAKVQLTIDGVPTTLTTTVGGAFTVRGVVAPGATVEFDVLPPPSTGLPRLVLTSTAIDLAQPIPIVFAATPVRSLANSVVRRGGNAVGNARVIAVGSVAGAGTIAGLAATGAVRVEATANGAGQLPAVMMPAAQLATVVEAAPGDWSQSTTNFGGTAPVTITAPAMTPSSTIARDAGGTGIAGATLDLVPLGVLAEAGVPVTRLISGAGGAVSANLVTGGSYDIFVVDPGRRGGRRRFPAQTALPAAVQLDAATVVKVTITDGVNPIKDALVQFRCADCAGLERMRAIAEGLTRADGTVELAVPRP